MLIVGAELALGSRQGAQRLGVCVGVASLLEELIDLFGQNFDIIARLGESESGGQRQGTEQTHEDDLSPAHS